MKNEKPGFAYIVKRVKNFLHPPVRIRLLPQGIVVEKDVEITVRDGTILRANIFRPKSEGSFPVLICAHPYGKDNLPRKGLFGYRPLFQYRVMNQPEAVSHSTWTSWESPDPAFWVTKGYVLLNVDLRGFFKSDGEGEVMSDQEAEDYYDVIEWAATQAWSTGKVGLNGVSYLAISQYKVAALHPPHLAAICPWEGFSDFYKDLARPGGIREDGFVKLWSSHVPSKINLRAEQVKRPLRDAWYQSFVPDLQKIKTPALICGSFSDQHLHSGGSFRAFREIGSKYKWLYTHRGGKWAVYYSEEALRFQEKFFAHFLKGEKNGMLAVPPIRLEVRDTGETMYEVKMEKAFPLPDTKWTSLYLNGKTGQLAEDRLEEPAPVHFAMRQGKATFAWIVPDDLAIIGPMKLKLYVQLTNASDIHLFAGVRKIRNGKQVVFEGSYGFGYDMVTKGWQKASLRKWDMLQSEYWRPEHSFAQAEEIKPGQIVELEFSLLPSATHFAKGDVLRLDVQGHWFFRKNLLINGPAYYEASADGTCILYSGGEYDSFLFVPVHL
jgi:uncharacterized protein